MKSLPVIIIVLLALSERHGTVLSGTCPTKADIVLILDSSVSAGEKNFKNQLQFAVLLTKQFTIGPKDVQFGAVVFSYNAVKLFDLNDHTSPESLERAILKVPYFHSETHTDKAIRLVLDSQMFSNSAGGRPDASKIVIIMTGGKSESTSLTLQAAVQLKASGVYIVTFGFGQVSLSELRDIASSDQNVFTADNDDVLSDIQKQIRKLICQDRLSESQSNIKKQRLLQNLKAQSTKFHISEEYNGRYYLLSKSGNVNEKHSQNVCEQAGGYLAEIEDSGEQAFIETFLKPHNTDWILIGGTDEGHKGRWIWRKSQRPLSYKKWSPNRPSDNVIYDCLWIRRDLTWFDATSAGGYFMCEIPVL